MDGINGIHRIQVSSAIARRYFSGAGDSTLQGLLEACGDESEEFLPGIGGAQVEADSPGVPDDDGSDADEFVSDGGACGVGQAGISQGGAPDVVEEHVGERSGLDF